MKINQLLLAIAFFLNATNLFAQSKLSGVVMDGADNVKLEKATVTLLNPKDSILQSFTWTKEGGKFLLPKVNTGHYKLIVSYPQYADLIRDINVNTSEYNLGELKLSKSALLIDEVLVQRKSAIVIKGDTLEYDAASFKVNKDAKVEDLLKVLPGITIGADGKITAQGKEVKKVLLDGEEFFGDDPTLITKNIRSDMVDKVQVYEKKSDLAVRTGIDDGERTQTIDIKLKEDKKKGMFGQVLGGAGTNNYYAGKIMANRFQGSQKIAIYGLGANDGLVGLGFEEGQKYGLDGGGNVTMGEGGSIMITNSGQDETSSWSGNYNGNGVPRALNAGISFSDKTKDGKHKINLNYKRTQLDVKNNNSVWSQNSLPDLALIDQTSRFSDRETKGNGANLRYDVKLDSMSDLTVKFNYNKRDQDNFNKSEHSQTTLEQQLITSTESNNRDISKNEALGADISLTRRFKKQRRSLTLNTNFNSNQANGKDQFYSKTNVVSSGSTSIIDQLKDNDNTSMNYGVSLNYSEPLNKALTATLGYNFAGFRAKTLNQSFNRNPITGVYDVLDETVLNDFDLTTIGNGLRAGLNWKKEKYTLNVSNRWIFNNQKREYNNLATVLERDQVSLTPSLSFRYNFSKNKSVSFNYNGNTLNPGLTQIEPLKQNSLQTINYLDNFNLKSGFSNRYSIYYNLYKQLKDISFYSSVSFNQNINAIRAKIDFNVGTGVSNIQYVNMDNPDWSINSWGGYRMPVAKKIALSLNMGWNVNYNNSNNYLSLGGGSSVLNNSESLVLTPTFGLSSYRADKWSFYLDFNPGIRKETSSVQPLLNNSTFVFRSNYELSYTFPKNFKIVMNVNQDYEAATKTLAAFKQVNMAGYISKKFLKDKSLETQLFFNDILNQNKGFRRYQNGNVVTQTNNDVLGRYAMFKLIYNFTTMKGGNN